MFKFLKKASPFTNICSSSVRTLPPYWSSINITKYCDPACDFVSTWHTSVCTSSSTAFRLIGGLALKEVRFCLPAKQSVHFSRCTFLTSGMRLSSTSLHIPTHSYTYYILHTIHIAHHTLHITHHAHYTLSIPYTYTDNKDYLRLGIKEENSNL